MNKGFTLIEIIVTMTIIAMLVGGSLMGVSTYSRNARDTRRKADLEAIRSALEQYRSNLDTGVYPRTGTSAGQGLGDVVAKGYLQAQPTDPKTNLVYTYQGCTNALPVTTCTPCDNLATYCMSYRITATLESGGPLTLTPQSIQ